MDYTQSPQVARQYRIVEVTLTKDADGKVTKVTPVENGGCIEFTDAGMFKVSMIMLIPIVIQESLLGKIIMVLQRLPIPISHQRLIFRF